MQQVGDMLRNARDAFGLAPDPHVHARWLLSLDQEAALDAAAIDGAYRAAVEVTSRATTAQYAEQLLAAREMLLAQVMAPDLDEVPLEPASPTPEPARLSLDQIADELTDVVRAPMAPVAARYRPALLAACRRCTLEAAIAFHVPREDLNAAMLWMTALGFSYLFKRDALHHAVGGGAVFVTVRDHAARNFPALADAEVAAAMQEGYLAALNGVHAEYLRAVEVATQHQMRVIKVAPFDVLMMRFPLARAIGPERRKVAFDATIGAYLAEAGYFVAMGVAVTPRMLEVYFAPPTWPLPQ